MRRKIASDSLLPLWAAGYGEEFRWVGGVSSPIQISFSVFQVSTSVLKASLHNLHRDYLHWEAPFWGSGPWRGVISQDMIDRRKMEKKCIFEKKKSDFSSNFSEKFLQVSKSLCGSSWLYTLLFWMVTTHLVPQVWLLHTRCHTSGTIDVDTTGLTTHLVPEVWFCGSPSQLHFAWWLI